MFQFPINQVLSEHFCTNLRSSKKIDLLIK